VKVLCAALSSPSAAGNETENACDDYDPTLYEEPRETAIEKSSIMPLVVGISGVFTALLVLYLMGRVIVRQRRRERIKCASLRAGLDPNDDPLLFRGKRDMTPLGAPKTATPITFQPKPEPDPAFAEEESEQSPSRRASSSDGEYDDDDEYDEGEESEEESEMTSDEEVTSASESATPKSANRPSRRGQQLFVAGTSSSAGALPGVRSRASANRFFMNLDADRKVVDDEWARQVVKKIPHQELETWIRDVYKRYNPQKAAHVDQLLREYKGKEDKLAALVNGITQKYRLHPSHFARHFQRNSFSCDANPESCAACGATPSRDSSPHSVVPDMGADRIGAFSPRWQEDSRRR